MAQRKQKMKVASIKTHKITSKDNLFAILDRYVTQFSQGSILVIASKIVAISERRIKKLTDKEKDELVKKEADLYLPKEENAYGLYITIKNNYLTYSSGIDESNADGYAVLWPQNPAETANKIREYLVKKFGIKYAGVIITDMSALPLSRGIIAGAIAYSGFRPIKDWTGKKDVFGATFKFTKAGILQGLAAAAGVVMGEGSEQTPLGIIEDLSFVEFVDRNPTKKELESLKIKAENDLFGPMIQRAPWKKGGGKKS
jgi:dihydrofolate synthase / folylpolyglutamate synthase